MYPAVVLQSSSVVSHSSSFCSLPGIFISRSGRSGLTAPGCVLCIIAVAG